MALDVLLTAQRQRDLAQRARPLALAIRQYLPAARISLAIAPGPHQMAALSQAIAWGCFDQILRPQDGLRLALGGRRGETDFGHQGIIVDLGTGLAWRKALTYRLGWPVVAYTESTWRRLWGIQRLLLAEQGQYVRQRASGHTTEHLAVVGPLIVDAVRPTLAPHEVRRQLHLSTRHPLLGLMVGSTPERASLLLPLFVQAIDDVARREPAVQAVLPLAPGLSLDALAGAVTKAGAGFAPDDQGHPAILTPGGHCIHVLPAHWQLECVQSFDVALVGPGTHTAELGCLGVPMIAVRPPQWPENAAMPLLSRWWHERGARRQPFVAWPNRKAGRAVTPEIFGAVGPAELSAVTLDLLRDGLKRRQISLDLRQVMGLPGAARQIAAQVWDVAGALYPDLGNLWVGEAAGKSH